MTTLPAAPEQKSEDAALRPMSAPPPVHQIDISGRFDKHRSSYWAALLAVFGARYAPRPLWRKYFDPAIGETKDSTGQLVKKDGSPVTYWNKHKYSVFAGAVMEGVATHYAISTWKDMKAVFAETLGWEFDKKPEEVGFKDFWNSKNSIVQETLSNFMKYTARRMVINATFFAPYILGKKLFTKLGFHNNAEAGVDFGMAANAGYLFLDVLNRKATPFEELQTLVDTKINREEMVPDLITAKDLLSVYERHAARGKKNSFNELRGSAAWDRAVALFERMADLMNQTYKNVTPHEFANFEFSEFIHLVGHGLIDPKNIDQARLYVEVANRYDVHVFKQAVKEVEQGATVEQLQKKYGVAPEAPAAAEAEVQPKINPLDYKKPVLGKDTPMPASAAAREDVRRSTQQDAQAGISA